MQKLCRFFWEKHEVKKPSFFFFFFFGEKIECKSYVGFSGRSTREKLIFSLHYSTPLHSPSFPPPSKQAIEKN